VSNMMTDRVLATFLIFVLSCAGITAAAAQSPATPHMNTGFTANRSPKTPTVSPTADQIETSNVIGANVQDAKGTIIAKVGDLVIDRKSGAALAIISSLGGRQFPQGKSAVAWSSLQFEAQPVPHFVTRLDQQALASGSALVEQAQTSKAYYDVKNDVIGKPVIGADGKTLGHVQNLVLTLGTGRPVAMVIDTGGLISIGANNHAVAWDVAKPKIGENGGPVRIALSKGQVEGAPLTATMAPAPIPPKSGNNQIQIRRDSAGNISGSRVPAPANSR
jgi:sporulation protein YlmC with PRC-barrel domain